MVSLSNHEHPGSPFDRLRTSVNFSVLCVLCVLGVLCVFYGDRVLAQQPERARTEALARRATERLQALQREAERLAVEERTVLGDLRKLEIERQLKAEELKQIDADVARVQTELSATTAGMQVLEGADTAQRPHLRARVVELYKLGRNPYLRLILSTADVRQLGRATRTVAALAALDRERIASHQRTLDDLKSARATLEERNRQLTSLRADAERAQTAIEGAVVARNDLVRDIDRKRDVNAQLSGELQTTQQRLQTTLRGLATGAAGAGATALPLRPFRGELDWPVEGGIVRRPFGNTGGSVLNGVEIASAQGAHATAIHDGTVAFAGTFSGFGNLVILDHGSQTFSLYGDLLEIAVKKGARVDRGQAVGTVGPTRSAAAGLYFELRVDGRPVDPLQWLKKR
jgi:septal ring factor EnvC (AmiA/AmiB activator)